MKLNGDDLRTIALFESVTGTRVVDMVVDEGAIHFLVSGAGAEGVIGKGAENLKRFRELTGKQVDVFVHNSDERRFVRSLLHRYRIESLEIVEEGGKRYAHVRVAPVDKARAIGRKGRNINLVSELARKHSGLSGIRIE